MTRQTPPATRQWPTFRRPGLVVAASALVGLALLSPARAGDLDTDIDYLLRHVAGSHCLFIRNGKTHDGAEAARHMERKYRHFRDDIHSIDQFIDKAATKSLVTGRAYRVRCPGAGETRTAAWLRSLLDAPRSATENPDADG